LLLEAAQAMERISNRVKALLKDDLLRCMLELLIGPASADAPAPMRRIAL